MIIKLVSIKIVMTLVGFAIYSIDCVECLSSSGIWEQIGFDIDGEDLCDNSGWSVSLSADGTTVAIGAYLNDGNGNDAAGHVRVYKIASGSWVKVGQDIDGEFEGDYSGSSVSISADGTTVAIGATANDETGLEAGHVRIYALSSGNWIQIGQDIDGEAADDRSGGSVSISADGKTVAIGAAGNNGYSGHVRVYTLLSGSWVQVSQDIDGEFVSSNFGASVSMSADGRTIAIGASTNDEMGNDVGKVSVFTISSGSWMKVGQDIYGEGPDDLSGNPVSLSADGKTVAIGAVFNDETGNDAGHVRVYTLLSGSWVKVGKDIDGETACDQSGNSLGMSADGTIIAIGSRAHNGYAGHVRVFTISNGNWEKIGQDIDGEANYQSGYSVSMSADGTVVAIGSIYANRNAGYVRVYKYMTYPVSEPVMIPVSVPIVEPVPLPVPIDTPITISAPVPVPLASVIAPVPAPEVAPIDIPVPAPVPIIIPLGTAPVPLDVPIPAPVPVDNPISSPVEVPVPIAPTNPIIYPVPVLDVPIPIPASNPNSVPINIPVVPPTIPIPIPVTTPLTHPAPVTLPIPITGPVFLPAPVPVPLPVTQPVPVVPLPVPVAVPVLEPIKVPAIPNIPVSNPIIPLPTPIVPVSVLVPVIPNTPVSNPTLPLPTPILISAPVPLNIPVTIPSPVNIPLPVSTSSQPVPIQGPVTIPVSLPTKVPTLPIQTPFMTPNKIPTITNTTSKIPTKSPTIPLTTTTPTTTSDDDDCGFFGLNFFCPRPGECGFIRRLFNIDDC